MNFREIRQQFLDYFSKHDHRIVESSSLIPRDDPTLLFTNAGMVQFKNAFLGENVGYTRAATAQKCVRAGGKHNDLDNVGYTPRHHTFFEMLGNFSFGDYFKEEAIRWGWELLTEGYGLPAEKLHVSVYKDDDEAYDIWQKEIGLPADRIVRLGEKDNFWAMGDTGPCGPCSEIHIDQGPSVGCGRPECACGCDCDRYLEIWNLVFTQFDRSPDGKLTPLPKPNIDTGMGLERLAAVIQGVKSNYDTDLFRDIITRIESLSQKKYGSNERMDVAFRVISDHARAVSFLIGDGIMPSNEGRGYVLRRIIRRASRFGQALGLEDIFLRSICDHVIELMGRDYGELVRARSFILGVVENEERRFADTLRYSMKVLREEIEQLREKEKAAIPGEVVFKLYDTYGLAVDLVEDVARDENLGVDLEGYKDAMNRQRSLSQESWKGSGEAAVPKTFRDLLNRNLTSRFTGYDTLEAESRILSLVLGDLEVNTIYKGDKAQMILDQTAFYAESGGQVGDTGLIMNGIAHFRVENTFKYGQDLIVHEGFLEEGELSVGDSVQASVDTAHRMAVAASHSATHLLHAALREILGDHVKQAGSRVAPGRLRFDFSHFTQVSTENLIEVERWVNDRIRENLPLDTRIMDKEAAMKTGAMAIFEEKYGDKVRIVDIGEGVSRELCGGTHTRRTGDIGVFRILSEGAVAANVRRIEALTGASALLYDQERDERLKNAAGLLKVAPDQLIEKLKRLLEEAREKEREIESLKGRLFTEKSADLMQDVREITGISVVAKELEAETPKELREAADRIKDRLGSGIVLLGAKNGGKVMLICAVTKDLTNRFNAGQIIRELSGIVGGKGGGRPDMAQGGGDRPEKLTEAFNSLETLIVEKSV
ncbi:alanine--tRNA ligase [delta proteobacterium NaphS2]|nr:alanine--tRNA ligase [delta proteobacterium NaphS2]